MCSSPTGRNILKAPRIAAQRLFFSLAEADKAIRGLDVVDVLLWRLSQCALRRQMMTAKQAASKMLLHREIRVSCIRASSLLRFVVVFSHCRCLE